MLGVRPSTLPSYAVRDEGIAWLHAKASALSSRALSGKSTLPDASRRSVSIATTARTRGSSSRNERLP